MHCGMENDTARIAARCTLKMKKQVERVERITGQKESEIIRVALEIFLAENKTPDQIMAAVVASRARRAA